MILSSGPYHRGPASDHFDGVRFFNPGAPDADKGLPDVLRWRFTSRRAGWPRSVPVTPARPEARVAGLRVTHVGHATSLIQLGGLNVLTDPVWSERASPFRRAGPRRATAPGVRFDDLPPIDAVLLSHNHYDHLDAATLARLTARDRPLIAAPLGNDVLVRRAAPDARVEVADWGGRIALGPDAEVVLTPANHWSARGLRDRRMALWAGHVLRAGGRQVYFAGDTGFAGGAVFRGVARDHGRLDLALLPIGAYEPRWFMAPQHMDPAEAVRAAALLGNPPALGVHWGTFQLTDEARDAPRDALAAALAEAGRPADAFRAAEAGGVYGF